MEPNRKAQIWGEIIAATKKENLERAEGEITVYEFIKQVQDSGGKELTVDTARKLLDKLVKQGRLTRRRVYLSEYRSTCMLYSPNESDEHTQTDTEHPRSRRLASGNAA